MKDNMADNEIIETSEIEETEVEEVIAADDAVSEDSETPVWTDGESVENEEEDKLTKTKAFSKRLKEEREKILKDAELKKQAELDKVAEARGFKDWEELQEYNTKDRLEAMGISDPVAFNAILEEAIAKNPIVVEAQKVIESQKEREQEETIRSAIGEITKIDSDIKSINDLIKLENYDEFYSLVSKGYSLPDAYKVVAFDKLATKRETRAAQNVMTNIDSKNHLKTTTGTISKDILVPEDVMMGYKINMPNMTDDEIRKHYAKFVGAGEK